MQLKNVVPMSLCILTVCSLDQAEVHALTPDVTVQFNLRATPGDPLCAVTHRVIMGVWEDSRSGDNVGWEVRILTIRELDENGDVAYRWSKAYPTVDTADGLWWIEHADPDNPAMEEFVLPARIYGTALALDQGVSDLDFDFEGNIYAAPPGGPPFDTTGSLDSFLRLAETPPPPPKKDESDEPVEIPDLPDSPNPI